MPLTSCVEAMDLEDAALSAQIDSFGVNVVAQDAADAKEASDLPSPLKAPLLATPSLTLAPPMAVRCRTSVPGPFSPVPL